MVECEKRGNGKRREESSSRQMFYSKGRGFWLLGVGTTMPKKKKKKNHSNLAWDWIILDWWGLRNSPLQIPPLLSGWGLSAPQSQQPG